MCISREKLCCSPRNSTFNQKFPEFPYTAAIENQTLVPVWQMLTTEPLMYFINCQVCLCPSGYEKFDLEITCHCGKHGVALSNGSEQYESFFLFYKFSKCNSTLWYSFSRSKLLPCLPISRIILICVSLRRHLHNIHNILHTT